MTKQIIARVIRAGWTNFRRNSYVSFGTTGVMALVLLLFLGLAGVNFMASSIVRSLQDKVDVSVYFKTDAKEDEIMTVKRDLDAMDNVKYVQYTSKEKALEEFKARHAGDALIQESLAELDENPLQASLNVKAKMPNDYASIVGSLESNKLRALIDKINYYENEGVIGRIQGMSRAIENWGLLATIVLAFVAVLVTFNTIRLTIYTQKNEVEIMRLVGGSNWYIRAPFMVEGIIYGTLATIIALVIFYPSMYFLSPNIAIMMPDVDTFGYFMSHIGQFIVMAWAGGMLLGIVSSLVAIRKFLKI